MTIVCAHSSHEGVWIGSDSRSSDRGFLFPVVEKKIFKARDWYFGLSGLGSGADYVAQHTDRLALARNPFEFANLLREIYRECGFYDRSQESKDGPPDHGQSATLASAAGVWGISSDYCIITPRSGFWATGSGQDFALSAAFVAGVLRPGILGEELVRLAISAAVEYRGDCGGEVEVIRIA